MSELKAIPRFDMDGIQSLYGGWVRTSDHIAAIEEAKAGGFFIGYENGIADGDKDVYDPKASFKEWKERK